MNSIVLPIGDDGPLVKLQIGFPTARVTAMRKQGQPVPQSIEIPALFDSGAEATCAEPSLLIRLIGAGLPQRRLLLTNSPALGGMMAAIEYSVGLRIVHPSGDPKRDLVLPRWEVIEQPLGVLGYQAIIGRDVLERCIFILDGPGKMFTLGY